MNPILIHKGDCTIFGNCKKFLTFNLESDLDLMGWTATFILGQIVKEITDISSKTFEVILGSQDTKNLQFGAYHGSITLKDAEGNVKTITNSIPFQVTNQVVENEYQEIDLTIPETSGVDIKLSVGLKSVTSVNGKSGEVELNADDIGAMPNTVEIPTVVSQLGNDLNFTTQGDVMQIIAGIPQFNISIVSELPTKGQKMTIYLVAKEGSNGDVYNEYIWIEENASYEFIGSTAVDLTDYVKNTDYATRTDFGLVRPANGLAISGVSGSLIIEKASKAQIDKKEDNYYPIVSSNLDYAVKTSIANNTNELTDDEKTSAQTWLGLGDVVRNTDYATSSKAGIMRPANGLFVSGNTGAIVIACANTTQIDAKSDKYYPIVPANLNYAVNSVLPTMTQAEYEALVENNEIDENLFYMIVEE